MSEAWRCVDCGQRLTERTARAEPVGGTDDDPWSDGVVWRCATCTKAAAAFPAPLPRTEER